MAIASIWTVHLAAAILLVLALSAAIRRRRLYAVLLAGLLIYQVLSLLSLYDYAEVFSVEEVAKGVIAAFVGICTLTLSIQFSESLTAAGRYDRLPNYFYVVRRRPQAYLFISLGFFVLMTLIAFGGRGGSLEADWETIRAERTFLDSVATLLQFVAFPAIWMVFRLGNRAIGLALLFISVAVFTVYGSRAALLTIPMVVALDFYCRGVRLRPRVAVLTGIGVFLFVGLMHIGGRLIRGLGLAGLLDVLRGDVEPLTQALSESGSIDWTGGEGGINYYYFFVISEDQIPGVEPLSTVLRWLTMYMPRWLVPDWKPLDPTYLLWLHGANTGLLDSPGATDRVLRLVTHGELGSLHATFWGEAWMNGGLFSLLLMSVVLGIVVVAVDKVYRLMPPTVVALMAPATAVGFLMIARGNSVIGFGYIAYLLPPVVLGYIVLCLLVGGEIGRSSEQHLQ